MPVYLININLTYSIFEVNRMKTVEITLLDPIGLHARPAAQFVEMANRFNSDIQICNLTKSGPWVNAKSILSILIAGVEYEDLVSIRANGPDESEAVAVLEHLIQLNFTEST
jgi:multiphosphoryl transfer protein